MCKTSAAGYREDVHVVQASTDPNAVREYCGAILRSPQFLLVGLPTWEAGTNPTPLSGVPCVDDLCTETEYCEHYRTAAVDLGYASFTCP